VTPNGTVLVTSDGTLTAVDTGNGSVAWERQTGSATAPAVAPDGTVAAPTATNGEWNSEYGITTYDADGREIASWSESTLDPGELDVRDQPLLTDDGLVTFSGGNDYSPAVHVTQRNGESVDELAPEPGFGTVSPLDSGRVLLSRGYQLRAVGSADAGDGSDAPFDASLSVDRFPEPGESLSVSANASTGAGTLTYEWAVNGSAVDCASATCELDVDYPADLSLTVTDAEGESETLSTVVRASTLELDPVENIPIDVFGDAEALADDTITFEADTSALGHDLDDVTWSVDGPADRTANGTDGLDIVFTELGRYNVTATAEVTDPASGQTGSVEATMEVRTYDLRDSLGRFDFVYEGAADSYQGRIIAAKIQDHLPGATRQVVQRTDGLPEAVTVRLTHPDTRDGCLTCAGDGTFYHRADANVRIEVVRHELFHLAQDRMNTEQDGDWNALIEGHATHEQDPWVDTIDEKPGRSAFLDWGQTFDEYQQASAFVAAFYAEYGRQAFLDLLRDSLERDMHARFEAVTGDSFESFYADWTPTNTSREIGFEPGFTYEDETLSAVVTDSLCADCSLPPDITATWNVDDDGTFELSGAEVSWSPETDAEYPITLRYERNGSSLAQTQVLRLDGTERFTVVGDATPTDPDGDGQYEDVNGDGTVNIVDVSAFFQNYQGETVQNNVDAFDYNGDGSVTVVDANRLFSDVQ
jgi:PKD repeat protein